VGGGTQEKMLCQFAADACGIPVYAGPVEATAIGNISMQAIASGELANVAEARELIRNSFDICYYEPHASEAWDEAKQDMARTIESDVRAEVRSEYHTSHVDSVRVYTDYRNVTYKYLLLPVWMSSFNYKGKNYRFMVNGRSGRVGGKYPVSPLRVAIAVLLGISAVALFAYLFMYGEADAAEVYIRNAESYFQLMM
jgi:hypothetical protein